MIFNILKLLSCTKINYHKLSLITIEYEFELKSHSIEGFILFYIKLKSIIEFKKIHKQSKLTINHSLQITYEQHLGT